MLIECRLLCAAQRQGRLIWSFGALTKAAPLSDAWPMIHLAKKPLGLKTPTLRVSALMKVPELCIFDFVIENKTWILY